LAAVEAMALGAPPVAAAHGSFRELVTDEVDGALFRAGDPGDLARVLTDIEAHPERYEEYGAHAKKTYEQRHDPAASMRQLIDIYEYAIANPVSANLKGGS
jgi:glycosyltransferase involved in cell wall biosynthesis